MAKENEQILKNPLISVITPLYNSEATICNCIKSVKNQTYANCEHIIVDDASTDNSKVTAAECIKKDKRFKLISLTINSGPAIARNKAIEIASGRFIAFLDSDDLWDKNKLDVQVKFMIKNKYYFTYTWYRIVCNNGEESGMVMKSPEKINYTELLKTNKIGCLTVMYDVGEIGKKYFPNIRKRQDYGLWLAIVKTLDSAYGIPKILASYRNTKNSISNNKLEMLKWNWKLYRSIENLSYLSSIFYLTCNVYYKLKYYLRVCALWIFKK